MNIKNVTDISAILMRMRKSHFALMQLNDDDISQILIQISDEWNRSTQFKARKAPKPFDYSMTELSLTTFLSSMRKPVITHNAHGCPVACAILAGNSPLLAWEVFYNALLARTGVFFKLSSHETFWTPLLIETINRVSQDVADCYDYSVWRGASEYTAKLIAESDAVIAYGSDATINHISALAKPAKQFIGYANRFSCAVLNAKTTTQDEIAGLALDSVRYFQLGCLSPKYIFVMNCAPDFLQILGEKIETATRRYDIQIDFADAVAVRRERELSFFNVEQSFTGSDELKWTLFTSPKPMWNLLGLFGVGNIVPINTVNDVADNLFRYKGKLQGIGYAGLSNQEIETVRAELNPPRFCRVGQMQTPPIDWNADGVSLWRELSLRRSLEE